MAIKDPPFEKRRAGLLLHPTSLPGGGVLGTDAYRFVDFMAACGFTVWQTLPLGPTNDDLSPYAAQSVHAGNTLLIALEPLVSVGLLKQDHGPKSDESEQEYKKRRLIEARMHFDMHTTKYQKFLQDNNFWLEDYSYYQAIRMHQNYLSWVDWPTALRDRDPEAMQTYYKELSTDIEQFKFEQFIFYQQWSAVKQYANERNILIFGDIPLFVGHDSAEVWAQRDCFLLDKNGFPTVVAGVPPDYFSSTGQLWGNPHYDWDKMRSNGFQWWINRVRTQLNYFDILRIDHFRGLESYWEIPAQAVNAISGRWCQVPGEELISSFSKEFGNLPLVAEDLGIITPAVEQLRDRHNIPGMKVLHFAFGGSSSNAYLPHNHIQHSVVYTGTHDNNTTLGWLEEIDNVTRIHITNYLGCCTLDSLVNAAFSSVAKLAIIPMQDILELDSSHRMNKPGITEGNWIWNFQWEQLQQGVVEKYRNLLELYGRVN